MIHDTLNTQANSSLKIPDLNGEVCIQLFDAKTGKLEQEVKGENIVTNAVKDIFAANYFGLVDYSKLMPIATKLFGGILCFEQTQTANASNYYPPLSSDNTIIAHAGQSTYSSAEADLTRGNPNDGESGVVPASGNTPLGYKLVWQFDTTQGVGTIRSVSLTHKDFGDWALSGGTNFNPVQLLGTSVSSNDYSQAYFYNETKREAYRVYRDNSNVIIDVYADSSKKSTIGLTQKFPSSAPYSANIIETVNVPMNVPGASCVMYLDTDQEIHVLYPYTDSGTGKIQRKIVNLSTFAVTSSDMTLEYPVQVSAQGGGQPRTMQQDEDGYIYLNGTNSKVHRQNYSNLADNNSVTLTASGDPAWYSSMGIGHYGFFPLTNGRCIVVDGNVEHRFAQLWTNSLVDYSMGPCVRLAKAPLFFRTANRYQYDNELYLWKMYLGSIYNLSRPIVKTAQQTMKITYTLSETTSNS